MRQNEDLQENFMLIYFFIKQSKKKKIRDSMTTMIAPRALSKKMRMKNCLNVDKIQQTFLRLSFRFWQQTGELIK